MVCIKIVSCDKKWNLNSNHVNITLHGFYYSIKMTHLSQALSEMYSLEGLLNFIIRAIWIYTTFVAAKAAMKPIR